MVVRILAIFRWILAYGIDWHARRWRLVGCNLARRLMAGRLLYRP